MINYQELVRPGDHMVLLYNDENDVVKPVVEFMVASLDRNERCIYVSGDTNMKMLKNTLGKYIDIDERIEKKDLFLLNKENAYAKDGEFEPDKMIELILSLTEESLELGYSGMSITGELSWVLDYGSGIDKIIEYEWKLNERVFTKKELTALCRYNLNKFEDEMITNIIQLHPIVVYKDKIHENPYYLPPDGYKERNLLKYQVATWLKNIDEFSNIKSKFDKEIRRIEMESESKSDFMSKISHDMKTPLSAIISLSEFGSEEIKDIKGQEYFNEIKGSAEYLLSLMNDILDYQKLKNNGVEVVREKTNILSFLNSVKTIINPQAIKKKLEFNATFDFGVEQTVYKLDLKKVSQILINILSNSIKYTEPGGTISWKATIESADGTYYLFNIIEDTGVGMSTQFQRHMFDSFAQEENILTQSEGGTGLGLPIVKQLIEIMKGEIKVESGLKRGTKVEITLPLLEAEKAIEKKINVALLEGKNILICEDVEINSRILMKHLEKTGANIDIVKNGIEAVGRVKVVGYDLIFMDLRMPLMNGHEATSEIRKFNSTVPIIIVSADNDKECDIEANAFLSKPIDKYNLFKTIESLI